jgi:hypothetical protein
MPSSGQECHERQQQKLDEQRQNAKVHEAFDEDADSDGLRGGAAEEAAPLLAILRPYLEGLLGIIGASLLAYGVARFVTTDDSTDEVRSIVVPSG